jgi:hypothetical protein
MKKQRLTIGILAGISGMVDHASAVNINPNGTGQALNFPYYTVNAGQQTLLSVVNTTNVGKVVKLRFLEGYNGRDVLDFNLYLSRHDVWTANIFSLGNLPGGAGGDSSFAGIFTTDNSCTDPALTGSGTFTNPATGVVQGYQQFLNYSYSSANSDTGPASDARTREGHIEMILMNDVLTGSELEADITHVQPQGVPVDCDNGDLRTATGYAPPTLDPTTGVLTDIADGGLLGSVSIVDVAQGTFYAYNADALDGFTYVSLYTTPGSLLPTLEEVNDRGSPLTATAHILANGETLTATFPGTAQGSRPVDAVSALFTADNVLNEYTTAVDNSISTDWVVTFPTKRFYVDAQPGGLIPESTTTAFAPFEEVFGQVNAGQSCILVGTGTVDYNREEGHLGNQTCPFECPGGGPEEKLCLETNVIRFQTDSALGSILSMPTVTDGFSSSPISPFGTSGWTSVDLATGGAALSNSGIDSNGHALYPATNGNTFRGLPVTGFAAMKFINGNVSGALANYTAAYHHRATLNCVNASGPCS